MTYRPFDIVNAIVKFNDCDDMRPWLIVRIVGSDTYDAFPVASQAYGDPHFPLDPSDPDFAATGLTRSCVILDIRTFRIHESQIRRQRGVLSGEVLRAFRDYAGV